MAGQKSRSKLTDPLIENALRAVPDWTLEGIEIRRLFTFPDFKAAMKFVNQVADLAEAADHHPDITLNWNRVTLSLTTHDSGGLTRKDFDLAVQIDALV